MNESAFIIENILSIPLLIHIENEPNICEVAINESVNVSFRGDNPIMCLRIIGEILEKNSFALSISTERGNCQIITSAGFMYGKSLKAELLAGMPVIKLFNELNTPLIIGFEPIAEQYIMTPGTEVEIIFGGSNPIIFLLVQENRYWKEYSISLGSNQGGYKMCDNGIELWVDEDYSE